MLRAQVLLRFQRRSRLTSFETPLKLGKKKEVTIETFHALLCKNKGKGQKKRRKKKTIRYWREGVEEAYKKEWNGEPKFEIGYKTH